MRLMRQGKTTQASQPVNFTGYYQVDQVKEDVMSRHIDSWWKSELHTRFWLENLKEIIQKT